MTSSPTSLASPEVKNRREEVLALLAPRYVWWPLEGSNEDRTDRTLAQVMNLGTYPDIRAIEAVFGRRELIAVMARAQPGRYVDRSLGFLAREALNICRRCNSGETAAQVFRCRNASSPLLRCFPPRSGKSGLASRRRPGFPWCSMAAQR